MDKPSYVINLTKKSEIQALEKKISALSEQVQSLSQGSVSQDVKGLSDKFNNYLKGSQERTRLNDLRWHGGGLVKVSTDNTLTGLGTPSSPLSALGLPLTSISFPEGFGTNYKIVTSVAGGNLTVALKTLAGNNPSATDPIYVRIGDTVRTITGALVQTIPAASNWFNLGSAELATQEVDLFTYLGWTSASSVLTAVFFYLALILYVRRVMFYDRVCNAPVLALIVQVKYVIVRSRRNN